MTHKTTFSNADGLVQGYGPQFSSATEWAVQNTDGSGRRFATFDVTKDTPTGAYDFALPEYSVLERVTYAGLVLMVTASGALMEVGVTGTDTDGYIAQLVYSTLDDAVPSLRINTGALLDTEAPLNQYAGITVTVLVTNGGLITAGKGRVTVEYSVFGA